jgi:hypothetical protein
MNFHDSLILFGLFIIFLGLGLLIYASLFGFYLRLHLLFFPKLRDHSRKWVKRLDSTN